MKVLYAINDVNIGGATDYLIYLLKENDDNGNSCKLVCKNNYKSDCHSNEITILLGNGNTVFQIFNDEQFDLIHWFKAGKSDLFEELCQEMIIRNQILPIITTVCQYPRGYDLMLTPNEISYSQQIVLIDKHAYSFSLNKYIDNDRLKMIYFGSNIEMIESKVTKINLSNNQIVFGRGSSLNKCHENLIDWFSDISIINKKFIIAGIGDRAEWLKKEITRHDSIQNISIIPHLPFENWLNLLWTFDIFLYQLPLDAYSSIDGTMQAAMLLGKPVVYYGPEPPKELIVHGVSGFIANNKQEFVQYATLLANDAELCKLIGRNGSTRIINDFNWKATVFNYKLLYEIVTQKNATKVTVSVSYSLLYKSIKIKYLIRKYIVALFPMDFKRNIKRFVKSLKK